MSRPQDEQTTILDCFQKQLTFFSEFLPKNLQPYLYQNWTLLVFLETDGLNLLSFDEFQPKPTLIKSKSWLQSLDFLKAHLLFKLSCYLLISSRDGSQQIYVPLMAFSVKVYEGVSKHGVTRQVLLGECCKLSGEELCKGFTFFLWVG